MEQGLVGKTEFLRNQPAVFIDLHAVGKFLRRHVAGFFQQRQITVGIIVTLDAGIAVPVPDAAEITREIDITEICDPRTDQVIGGQDPAETAAENGDI